MRNMIISVFRDNTKKVLASIGKGLFFVPKLVDLRDVLVFGGLTMLGYGLCLYQQWVGLSVSGGLLMALGLGWLTRMPRGAGK
jgi:hypothetical protein